MKLFQVHYYMLAKNAGIIVITKEESVTGVVLMDGAVEKIGRQEMAAMEHLVDNLIIYVFSNQVIYFKIELFFECSFNKRKEMVCMSSKAVIESQS